MLEVLSWSILVTTHTNRTVVCVVLVWPVTLLCLGVLGPRNGRGFLGHNFCSCLFICFNMIYLFIRSFTHSFVWFFVHVARRQPSIAYEKYSLGKIISRILFVTRERLFPCTWLCGPISLWRFCSLCRVVLLSWKWSDVQSGLRLNMCVHQTCCVTISRTLRASCDLWP